MQKAGHISEPRRIDRRIVFPVRIRNRSSEEHVESMNAVAKPYLHLSINAVDTVVFDPEGCLDNDRSDRFDTFEEARDAALSCVELMLDEEDYDDDDHRQELELMLGILENASSFRDLEGCPRYLTFLSCLKPVQRGAA
jgi:hypothetical protein